MRPKKQILLVDADEDQLAISRCIFTLRGYQVFSAISSWEALEQLKLHPGIAVAVVNMSGIRWVRLIREMGHRHPEVRTILTSEYFWPKGLEHHADRFLDGRYKLTALLDQVRILARRKRGRKKAHVPQEIAIGA